MPIYLTHTHTLTHPTHSYPNTQTHMYTLPPRIHTHHTHIHTYMCTHIHIYMHAHTPHTRAPPTYTRMYTHTAHTYIYMHIHMCTYTHTHTYTHMYTDTTHTSPLHRTSGPLGTWKRSPAVEADAWPPAPPLGLCFPRDPSGPGSPLPRLPSQTCTRAGREEGQTLLQHSARTAGRC